MGVDASAIVRSGSEASSVDSTFGSLSEGGHRGSLVPAEFRPLGSEGDVLCEWNLTMVPTKQDAAILGSGAFGTSFLFSCRGYFSLLSVATAMSPQETCTLLRNTGMISVLLVLRRLLRLFSDYEQTG